MMKIMETETPEEMLIPKIEKTFEYLSVPIFGEIEQNLFEMPTCRLQHYDALDAVSPAEQIWIERIVHLTAMEEKMSVYFMENPLEFQVATWEQTGDTFPPRHFN